MVELLQDHHLAECPLGVRGILESIKDLLESVDLTGFEMLDFPDVPVGPTAHLLLDIEPVE